MKLEQLLVQLKNIKRTARFSTNRDDARKAYHLLKQNVELAFEQNIYEEKLYHIKHSILVEDNEIAYYYFTKALAAIISIIEGSLKHENVNG
ncbi:hypothetical protein [uncultured Aquimarina sp.]|uniref:hypothetical protein n=1 Tax=uncultured Aquimarina sp. TaxID=575652 RepID=UPI002630C763|nr:hypothetical protein [uncultured Aquimarina sp.]